MHIKKSTTIEGGRFFDRDQPAPRRFRVSLITMVDKPADTGDRRRELRMAANKQIKVILIDGSMALLGTLFDLSLTGARVRVPLKIETGKKVDLIFDDPQRIRSTVIWHTETEIGVLFDATASAASSGGGTA